MQRRDFFKGSAAMAGALTLGNSRARAMVRAHNWGKYDFGSGPMVTDRLNQGPFPQYPPDAAIPGDDVVMATTPSEDVVPNYGKGLITYITADMGKDEIKADNLSRAIEELVRISAGPATLYPANLAGGAAASRTSGDAGLSETCLRSCKEEQQADRFADSDERTGLRARSGAP